MTQPSQIAAEEPAKKDSPDYRSIALLSASHMTDDINQGAVPAMLPFHIASHNLSYAAAAGLVLAQSMSSSVVQPIFGLAADRRPMPWLIPLGLSLAGIGVALTGLTSSYPLMFVFIAVSGLGIAAFHPEAARWTRFLGGTRQAMAMSLFAVGGNAGFVIGPLLITPAMALLGPHGALVLALPVMIMGLVLLNQMPHFIGVRDSMVAHRSSHAGIQGREQWTAFTLLTAAVMIRSVVFFGLNTFIPLYWSGGLHQSRVHGGFALSILLTSAAFGTLAGGWLADHYGRRIVVIISMAALPVLMFSLLHSGLMIVTTLLLIPLGFAMAAPSSVMIVMGQEYLPNRIGFAAGVTVGLSVTVGGLLMPAFGSIADHHGLRAALTVLAMVPAPGFLVSLALREPSADA
jgi:FSR family fosmidomycin resistance protein-like MFS transporter